MPPEKIKINVDSNRFSSLLGILTSISAGETSPLFIEERIRELQEFIPFLPMAIMLMAEAMERMAQAKEKDVGNDVEALREFLVHQDMLCRAQGAVAALLCVGEELRSLSKGPVESSSRPKRPTRRKKDVKNRVQGRQGGKADDQGG